jgi:hypothetical protein
MNITQGPSGFRNGEAALGGADAVPNTPQEANTGTAVQLLRKGEGPEVGRPDGVQGKGTAITLVSGAVLATIFVIVLLMLYSGFAMPTGAR